MSTPPATAGFPKPCSPVEGAGMKFYGVAVGGPVKCKTARSILTAYARHNPTTKFVIVKSGRERFSCGLDDFDEEIVGGYCSTRRGSIVWRSQKYVTEGRAIGCGHVADPNENPESDAGAFRVRASGEKSCAEVRSALEDWLAERTGTIGPSEWECMSLPAPAGLYVRCDAGGGWVLYDLS